MTPQSALLPAFRKEEVSPVPPGEAWLSETSQAKCGRPALPEPSPSVQATRPVLEAGALPSSSLSRGPVGDLRG